MVRKRACICLSSTATSIKSLGTLLMSAGWITDGMDRGSTLDRQEGVAEWKLQGADHNAEVLL